MSVWRLVVCAIVALSCHTISFIEAVRLNELQVLGTHNSFHKAPSNDLQAIRAVDPRLGFFLDANQYTHPDLETQLETFNVRSFEFDLYDDRPGGKFAARPVRAVLGLDDIIDSSPEMNSGGFKCMHVDSIDYETHCKTLASCLGVLKEWSDNNPYHIPLILRLELKLETMIETLERGDQTAAQTVLTEVEEANGNTPGVDLEMPRTDPPISAETVSLLIDEAVTVLGTEKLITPDDLRGNFASLREALSELGPEQFWPNVDTLRGKMLIIGGGFGSYLVDLYGPGLEQSPVFSRFFLQPGTTAQALSIPADVVFVEHYMAGTSAYLDPLIAEGFFLMAFSDLGGGQARSNDFSTYDEVVKAGPNVILTEFLEPAAFGNQVSEYSARLPCDGDYCVLPSNFTGPVREAPVISEAGVGGADPTDLQPVPLTVEPRLTEDEQTDHGSIATVPCMMLVVLMALLL